MKRRLIDANALKTYKYMSFDAYRGVVEVVQYDLIETAPTISAVEVVRCRECKHYAIDWTTGKSCCVRNGKVVGDQVWGGMVIVKDGYCNFGERRESEND